jgi:hypothetical protein
VGHTFQKIILKESTGIGKIALALDGMITIPVAAVGNFGLLIAETIDVLP